MAKEINFVRPQEVYDKETKKSVLQYGGYDGQPKKVVMSDSLDADVKGVIDDTFVPNASGNVVFTDGNDNTHELVIAENAGGGGGLIVTGHLTKREYTYEGTADTSSSDVVSALSNGTPVTYILTIETGSNTEILQTNTIEVVGTNPANAEVIAKILAFGFTTQNEALNHMGTTLNINIEV